MLSIRLSYLALLIGLCFFFILYLDPLSLILLAAAVLLPLIMFITGLISKLGTKIDISVERTVLDIGTPVKFKVSVKNKTIFPCVNIKIPIVMKNDFCSDVNKQNIFVSASALKENKYEFEIKSEHCGDVTFSFDKIYFYDPLKIWKFKKKIKKSFSVMFIPQTQFIEASLDLNSGIMMESDVFSKNKPGDDPSEVFKIREYQGGDKFNRIHWKLSTKSDNLLVKEYSLPINQAVLLLIEFKIDTADAQYMYKLDSIVCAAISISNFLAENEVAHMLEWYDLNHQYFHKVSVESPDETFAAAGAMLSSGVYTDSRKTLENFMFEKNRETHSHIIYLTMDGSDEALSQFESSNNMSKKTCIIPSYDDKSGKKGRLNVIYADPSNIAASLRGIVL